MKCQDCDLEMKAVTMTAYGFEVMANTGAFKGSGVEGMVCPECGRLELRVKNPERLWKTKDK